MRVIKFLAGLGASVLLISGAFVLGVLLMGEVASLVHWLIVP